MQYKISSILNLFFHPSHINSQNQNFQSSYKKCHPTYFTSNLAHSKCGIAMISDLIRMKTGRRWYIHISYSWITECRGPKQVKYHHSGTHSSSSPALIDSVLPPLCWFTRAPTTIKISITTFPVIGKYTIKRQDIWIVMVGINPRPNFSPCVAILP